MTVRTQTAATLAVLALAFPLSTAAAISPDEAKQLGSSLTPIGAERAGNADGSIPAYTGGLTTPPPGFRAGSGSRPDPFAGEERLFSIDARNEGAYASRLADGTRAMMRKYPAFRIDVYPTHRTVAFPAHVLENTLRYATKSATANDGLSLAGVRAAYPFPIPKSGNEAMWNHLLRFTGQCDRRKIYAFHVEPSGARTMTSSARVLQDYPFWDERRSDNVYFRFRITYDAPSRRAGEAMMLIDPIDYTQRGRRAWQYLPGQRRVRVAPDLAYDTPNAASAGAQTFDDALLFNGKMDRYDFKLVGKREIYVPYNAYRAVYGSTPEQLLKQHFLEPDLVRWELHRVWVVDATLKPGKRHMYSRRVLYLDEDSWAALMSDQYDARGELYRVGMTFMAPSYDLPGPWPDTFLHYDLMTGAYGVNSWPSAEGWVRQVECPGDAAFAPDALAGGGVR